MGSDKRAKIEATYRRLPVQSGLGELIPSMVDQMMRLFSSDVDVKPLPAFNVIGRSSTQKELDRLSESAEALARCISALHEPAITALCDGAKVPDGRYLKFVERHSLLRLLTDLAALARSADLSAVPDVQGRGRPTNNLALGAARILAFDYQQLTGKAPTVNTHPDTHKDSGKAYGPFLDLVTGIFDAVGIPASPEAMARKAVAVTMDARAS